MVKHLISMLRICYTEYVAKPKFTITQEAK